MENIIHFTPTEHRILKATSDGELHTHNELMECLDDELSSKAALYQRLSELRAKLRPFGQDIVAVSFGKYSKYRRIRHLCLSIGT